MSRRPMLLALAALALLAGCGRAPGVLEPGEAAGGGETLFATLDLDADGRLTRLESGLPGFAFDRLDRDRDGVLGYLEWSESRGEGSLAFQQQLRNEAQRDLATGSGVRGTD